LRYVLALFVHEQQIDYDFISAMLDSSQHLYFLENNRKVYLTRYIVDHGIWSNVRMWKECIDLNIKRKMNESTERINARNKLKEQQSKKATRDDSSVRESIAKGKSLLGKTFGKIKKAM